jgi:hypothetical protein
MCHLRKFIMFLKLATLMDSEFPLFKENILWIFINNKINKRTVVSNRITEPAIESKLHVQPGLPNYTFHKHYKARSCIIFNK